MPFANNQRITRRRSSAGPTPPKRPTANNSELLPIGLFGGVGPAELRLRVIL